VTVAPDGGGTTIVVQVDGATCVDVSASSFDTSCTADSDCMSIYVGQICGGSCAGCVPNLAINVSGDAQYEADLASISGGGGEACPCPASSVPRCGNGTCVLCSIDPNAPDQPPACIVREVDAGGDDSDASSDDTGTGTTDGGTGDGGFTNDAGVHCVDVDLSTFDTSCVTNSDCTVIQSGQICDGSCECGGSPVNVDGEATYQQDVSGIVFAGCPCAAELPPACVGNICTTCTGSPSDPPECGDTGG
jgi:hypothetical protein